MTSPFESEQEKVGTARLAELIDKTDDIEKLFHKIGGKGVPEFDEIHDIQEFIDWEMEIKLELQDIYDRLHDTYIWETINVCGKRMNGINDKEVFADLKGRLKSIRRNIRKYYPDKIIEQNPMRMEKKMPKQKNPKIFISHSSKDIEYVARLVNLLDGMGLDQTQVFCSSLPGYGIPIDTNIFDFLREQFLEYDLHVIFVHSANYYQSPVSLNEMGAAWALKNTVTSVLLPGFDYSQMAGVVNNKDIAIKLDSEEHDLKDKLNQLYDKIAGEFNLTKKSSIIWEQKRDAFITDIQQLPQLDSNRTISEEAERLLETAANHDSGQILKTEDTSGTSIQGGMTVMNENVSQREAARWEAALDDLLRIGYITQADKKGQVFKVTDSGYKHVEKK